MLRLLRPSLLVVLLAVPFVARGATSPAGGQDATAAAHPLVGAWVLDIDVESAGDPPIYLLVHADGTWLVATPYYGDGVGAWQPTGARTADATVVFQDINPDWNQVVIGTLTAGLAIEVDATGDVFAARLASEGRWPDGILAELDRPGHAAIDPARFAVAGYSFGGVPAVVYAATAAEEGLPVPKALFVMAPCLGGSLPIGATPGSTCQVPPANPAFPLGLKAVVLAFGQDFLVGIDMPRQVFGALASLPEADRAFVVMASDGHGQPPVLAGHGTPSDGVDAADRYGVWKLADALFACAFDGTWCESALGNTPEQRFMGTWSDGVPVAELSVAGDTAASGA